MLLLANLSLSLFGAEEARRAVGKLARLWVANTPPYSPEFNPDELVWANLKRVQIPNRVAKNVKELKGIAQKGMDEIQKSVELVKSFFNTTNFFR